MNKRTGIPVIISFVVLALTVFFVLNTWTAQGVFAPAPDRSKAIAELNESGNALIASCMQSMDETCDRVMKDVRQPCQDLPSLDRCTDSRVDAYLAQRHLL